LSPLARLIFLPILSASALAFGAPARTAALAAAGATLVVGLWLAVQFDCGKAGYQFAAARMVLEAPEMGFNVGLDGMSLVMVLLTVIVTMAAVGGCWWPIDLEPRWMQRVALAFPTTWAMAAYNDLMIRRQTFEAALRPTAVLLAYGVLYLAIGLALFRRRSVLTR